MGWREDIAGLPKCGCQRSEYLWCELDRRDNAPDLAEQVFREMGLSKQEAQFCALLEKRRGNVVLYDAIAAHLDPLNEWHDPRRMVSVLRVKVNKKLAPYGGSIETQWGDGMKLKLPNPGKESERP